MFKADIPDIDPKEVGIQLENGTLTLKGERKFEQENTGKGFHRIERGYGTFVRAFSLPDTVDAGKGEGRLQERRSDGDGSEKGSSEAKDDQRRNQQQLSKTPAHSRARLKSGRGTNSTAPFLFLRDIVLRRGTGDDSGVSVGA